MRAARRRTSTTEHGHAALTREYQSDPWSIERPQRSAPRSPPPRTHQRALTEVTPYQGLEFTVNPRAISPARQALVEPAPFKRGSGPNRPEPRSEALPSAHLLWRSRSKVLDDLGEIAGIASARLRDAHGVRRPETGMG